MCNICVGQYERESSHCSARAENGEKCAFFSKSSKKTSRCRLIVKRGVSFDVLTKLFSEWINKA